MFIRVNNCKLPCRELTNTSGNCSETCQIKHGLQLPIYVYIYFINGPKVAEHQCNFFSILNKIKYVHSFTCMVIPILKGFHISHIFIFIFHHHHHWWAGVDAMTRRVHKNRLFAI